MKTRNILFVILILLWNNTFAQTKPRFWDDVQVIKAYDKIYQPIKNPVLFIGSSSIRKWDALEKDFSSYNALNRGVGGTVINDITYYIEDLVFPYQPKQIVIYVGENDLPNLSTTPDSILNMTKNLVNAIRKKLPNVPIAYISMKPSPVRAQFFSKAVEANSLLKAYFTTQKNSSYIDVFTPMLDQAGKPRPELFVSDMLHMNLEGYKIWYKAVKPKLLK